MRPAERFEPKAATPSIQTTARQARGKSGRLLLSTRVCNVLEGALVGIPVLPFVRTCAHTTARICIALQPPPETVQYIGVTLCMGH